MVSDDLQAIKWVEKQEVLESIDDDYVKMLPEVIAFFRAP